MSIIPKPTRTGTITAIVNGIATVALDAGGTVTFHVPSTWNGYTGAWDEDFTPPIGTRVQVFGGSSIEQASEVWREDQ